MASKLMGLRDDLDQLIETEAAKVLTANQFLPLPGFDGIVDAIVSAAHAEGVAEGAEQEREKIRDNSLHYRQFDKMEPNIVAGEHNDYAFAQEDLFVVLASVLAPTKEVAG